MLVLCEKLADMHAELYGYDRKLGTDDLVLKLRCARRLGLRGLNARRPYYLQFTMDADEEMFYAVTREEAAKAFDPLELVYPKEIPAFEK